MSNCSWRDRLFCYILYSLEYGYGYCNALHQYHAHNLHVFPKNGVTRRLQSFLSVSRFLLQPPIPYSHDWFCLTRWPISRKDNPQSLYITILVQSNSKSSLNGAWDFPRGILKLHAQKIARKNNSRSSKRQSFFHLYTVCKKIALQSPMVCASSQIIIICIFYRGVRMVQISFYLHDSFTVLHFGRPAVYSNLPNPHRNILKVQRYLEIWALNNNFLHTWLLMYMNKFFS